MFNNLYPTLEQLLFEQTQSTLHYDPIVLFRLVTSLLHTTRYDRLYLSSAKPFVFKNQTIDFARAKVSPYTYHTCPRAPCESYMALMHVNRTNPQQ